jgi:osmotically-inducible protein OsmY
MDFSYMKRHLIICAYVGSSVCSLGALVTRVGAQNAVAPTERAPRAVTASTRPEIDPVAEEELRERVQAALHSDPFFYDAHVTVSVEKGNVLLEGFVFSDWDLLDALRIAKRAAGNSRVIDNLSIEVGGRK